MPKFRFPVRREVAYNVYYEVEAESAEEILEMIRNREFDDWKPVDQEGEEIENERWDDVVEDDIEEIKKRRKK